MLTIQNINGGKMDEETIKLYFGEDVPSWVLSVENKPRDRINKQYFQVPFASRSRWRRRHAHKKVCANSKEKDGVWMPLEKKKTHLRRWQSQKTKKATKPSPTVLELMEQSCLNCMKHI